MVPHDERPRAPAPPRRDRQGDRCRRPLVAEQPVGRQTVSFRFGDDDFVSQLAPARTFVFEHEARELRARGLGKHLTPQELPKTRSGKIMRRLLRDIAENRELGDVTTLTDSSVMNLIKDKLPATSSED